MQPQLCSRCKKNIAVVFITRQENGQNVNEGLCLKCAKNLGLPQVDEMMRRMGITDEDLDNISNEMMGAFGGAENLEGLTDADDPDADNEDEDGKTATFPFLSRFFGGNPAANDAQNGNEAEQTQSPRSNKKVEKGSKHKFLDSYCINLSQRARDGKLDAVIGREEVRKTELSLPFRREMLKASYAKDIFRLSAPNSLQQASGTIITTVKQGLLGGLGVAAIAGFSCAGKLSSLLMMPVYGFVQSIVFFIAQNTTAQQPGRVHTGLREGQRILFFYSLLVAALCIGLNGPLLRLFTTDAAAAAYGSTMLAFESISYVFTAQKHLCEARLRGAQKMGLYLASNLGQIGLNLAACVLLVPRIGFSGFWLSTWISAPAGLALAALLARIGAKQQS